MKWLHVKDSRPVGEEERTRRPVVPYDVAFDFILGGVALGPLPPRR
jgi:hypothetical protein